MTTIATGVFKKLSFKKQSGLGTAATGTGAQYLRRVTSSLDLNKATYSSKEIRASQQISDFRHGVRSVAGTINGELSCGTYQSFMESILRQAAQTAATTGAITTITAAVTTGAHGTFTDSATGFITDGFKIGDVVRWTGFTATVNNAHNFLITSLTAGVMTGVMLDGVAITAEAAGSSVTCTVVGKKSWIPLTGHTHDYYTVEHWFSDIAQSEEFTDCVVSSCDIKLPATGMATVDFGMMGLGMTPATAEHFTTPAAASAGGVLAAVNGAIYVAGVAVGLITSLDISIKGNHQAPGGVVGSNVDPDIFPGVIDVTGNMTVLFQDATMRDYFINETEVSIVAAFTASNDPNASFVAVVMSAVKLGGSQKSDGQTGGLTMTMPFTALENTSGSTVDVATTISIQDSDWV